MRRNYILGQNLMLANLHKIHQNMQIRQHVDPKMSKVVRDPPLTLNIVANR
jgi:hypothetical protein